MGRNALMSVAIEIRGLDDVRSMLAALGGEMEAVNKYGQNKMAYELMLAEREQMKTDLDRPNPWSVGSVRYKQYGVSAIAAPDIKGAAVYMLDQFASGSRVGQDEYLGVQILGGKTAGPRRSEKVLNAARIVPKGKVWVPAAGVSLDRYGNIPGARFSEMLTDFGLNPYAIPSETFARYVPIGPKGNAVGIFRKLRGKFQPFIWFVDPKTYTSRYDWYGRADREVDARFAAIWDDQVSRALRRL
jgi:hypothetical protein